VTPEISPHNFAPFALEFPGFSLVSTAFASCYSTSMRSVVRPHYAPPRCQKSWPAQSFERSPLLAQNKSPNTIYIYVGAATLLRDFLRSKKCSTMITSVGRADVDAFIADQLVRSRPATPHQRYRSLQTFSSSGALPRMRSSGLRWRT
jgi:hypothetical protein